MNIFRLAFELFVIYMLYKFIFEFIIPVYRTTKNMKQKMTDLHHKMQQQQETPVHSFNKPQEQTATSQKSSEDYIEYEEVK